MFAKVIDDKGEHFSAFLVERAFKGVSNGKEEHKMGLHGSSTTPVILQDVRVPAENLLGEVGKGHKIAFNVLNFARFKLGAMGVGGARGAIGEAARYAGQRKQFGQPIAAFGAIKHKLGEMVVRAYAVESLVYRTAGMIDTRIEATPHEPGDQSAALAALEEYAIEASIAKVAGSEMLDYVLDENIQVHGGNGYVRDYPAERHYRDSRVNRIFEGTNEINRLLIPGMLARRAAKGDIGLIAAARALQDELMGPPSLQGSTEDGPLADERRAVESFKKAVVDGPRPRDADLPRQAGRPAGSPDAPRRHADRHLRRRQRRPPRVRVTAAALQIDAARVFVSDAGMRIEASARQALAIMVEGDALRTMMAALRRLFKAPPVNTAVLRRKIADEAVSRGGYIF